MTVNARKTMNSLATMLILFSCAIEHAKALDRVRFGDYSFSWIASTDQDIQFLNSPKLSEDGAVAYRAFNYDTSSAIYFWDGSIAQKVIESGYAYDGGTFDLIYGNIDMNNNHVIAFSTGYFGAAVSPRFGVFTITPGGSLTRISTDKNTATYFSSRSVSINDAGELAYLGSANTYADVYATTPSGPALIFRGRDFNRSPDSPDINDSGLISFSGSSSSAGIPDDVFVYDNGQVVKIDSAHAGSNGVSNAALNNNRQIVYTREITSFVNELMLFENGQATALPIASVVQSRVVINDAGLIGFKGLNSNGGAGIRTSLRGQVRDVLGFGDVVFGKRVSSVGVWDVNEFSQLALTADFHDGSRAVLLATPIPESATLTLMVMAIITAYSVSSCRRRS